MPICNDSRPQDTLPWKSTRPMNLCPKTVDIGLVLIFKVYDKMIKQLSYVSLFVDSTNS